MKVLNSFIVLLSLFGSLAKADIPAVHGMVLFGEKNLYASHMPMFHSPHDYQVIMKLEMADIPRSMTLQYYQTAKAAGKTLFTLEPKPMDLTKVIDGTTNSFLAILYDGHFEKGGKKLGIVSITVEKLIYAKKFKEKDDLHFVEQYLMFGEKGEYFAAHIIDGKPSFDVILKVTQPYTLDFPLCEKRVCPAPKQQPIADSLLPITASSDSLKPTKDTVLGNLAGVMADVLDVLYFEEAELSL